MSGKLQINFAADMPAAAVEVISPDLDTVERILLQPGQTKHVDVPSEGSFLRVHLASGKVVTLTDAGNLNRTISLSNILSREAPRRSRRDVERAPVRLRRRLDPATPAKKSRALPEELEGGIQAALVSGEQSHAGVFSEDRRNLSFSTSASEAPFELRLTSPALQAVVRLPGDLSELTVVSDKLRSGRRLLTIRARTSSQLSDAIAAYLCRGDLYSAEAMSEWANEAEDLLQQKMRDPFAAAIGAYLLLRLRRFDRLSSWSKNLADWFPHLSDGSVIYAWTCVYQRINESDIKKYIETALNAPLPAFTEGLKLLRDGVRLLDKPQEALQALNSKSGVVIWNSPFTTTCRSMGDTGDAFDVDVGYDAHL